MTGADLARGVAEAMFPIVLAVGAVLLFIGGCVGLAIAVLVF